MVARHDKYYFEDGNVVFQVGEKLYRINKRMLVGSESSVFTSMFSLPQHQNTEGQTDEKPIVLKGEDPEQFEALMRILYPALLEDVSDIPIATYILAMHIAIKWSMDDVQVAIIKVIQTPQRPLSTQFERLAFVAEFPSYFSKALAMELFVNASSIKHLPTLNDILPFTAHTAILALLMQYREGLGKPGGAPWIPCSSTGTPDWLNENFKSLGFKS